MTGITSWITRSRRDDFPAERTREHIDSLQALARAIARVASEPQIWRELVVCRARVR